MSSTLPTWGSASFGWTACYLMGAQDVDRDRTWNLIQYLGGKAKETTGEATDNEDLEAEGKADQTKASFKDAADKVKDGLRDVNKGLH